MPVTAALVVAIALVSAAGMVRTSRGALAARRGAVRRRLLVDRDLRDRLDRRPGDRLGRAGSALRIPKVRAALEPVFDLYKNLDRSSTVSSRRSR
jgi:hypothetical protein